MEPIRHNSGVTIIELLVVLAIITILAGVVVTSQSAFNKTFLLSNTAYDVALTIRSAETFGLGSRAATVRNAGYGVHFDASTPGSFNLFADKYPGPNTACHPLRTGADGTEPDATPGNCIYDSGANQDVLVTPFTLGNGITISNLYVNNMVPVTSLDIVFARPNTKTFISINGTYSNVTPITKACIRLKSPQGNYFRFVSVRSSGEITANASSCP